jgi:hypothetical protein
LRPASSRRPRAGRRSGSPRPACTPPSGGSSRRPARAARPGRTHGRTRRRRRGVRQPGAVAAGRHELGERHALLEVEQVEASSSGL